MYGGDISLDGFEILKKKKNVRKKGKSLLEFLTDYTVIDIETTGLYSEFDEILELSAVKYRNNKMIDKFTTLVRPEEEIDEYITDLTGITNEMVTNAPSIEEALPKYLDFIGTDIVVGHNVNFDINFIYDNNLAYFEKIFTNNYVDTLRIARKLFPNFKNHKLSTLVEELHIENKPEHRGLADCLATQECYLKFDEFVKINGADALAPKAKTDLRTLKAESDNFDTTHPLYGKVCVFTGKLELMSREQAAQLVVNLGGTCGNGVTKKTNYLILGNNDYCSTIKDGKSSKQKKAEQLILSGQDLQIIPEDVFYELVLENVSEN